MNKWKTTFIFLSGFMLHEVLTHCWISMEGLLPFRSKLFFDLTITSEMNMAIIATDIVLLVICVYFGFFQDWRKSIHAEGHA